MSARLAYRPREAPMGLCRSSSPIHCEPVSMPPCKEPYREEGRTLWAMTHEEDHNEP
jgi:hypothetical protein